MTEQKTIEINGREYDVDSLSDKAKVLVQMIMTIDAEMGVFRRRLDIYQTARNLYVSELKKELPESEEQVTH